MRMGKSEEVSRRFLEQGSRMSCFRLPVYS